MMKSAGLKYTAKLFVWTEKDMITATEGISVKMRFGSFIFPANPKSLEICSNTNVSINPVFSANSSVQNVSVNPVIVKGNGEFFGNNAEELCNCLQHMLKTKESGILILPTTVGMNAYLTDFTFSRSADKSSIYYSFVFTECCDNKSERRNFYYTSALLGENAFMIANRCGVSVNDIMRNNDFKTPFDIQEGDRVVLR